MFALASLSFDAPSTTFIRLHARRLAPGNTVFVSTDLPEDPLPGPVLVTGGAEPVALSADGKDVVLGTALSRKIWNKREHHIARFLKHYSVKTLMAEFGPRGVAMRRPTQMAGVDLYVHFHGSDGSRALREERWQNRYPKLFEDAKGIFAPSRFIADNLVAAGCPADKITVTPCGIEPEHFPLSERQPKRCLAVGRFVEKKAPDITVRAFLKAAEHDPDVVLDFVGDGPLLETCKDIAGGSDQIRFHGSTGHDRVRALMGQATYFLQHSVTAEDGNTEGLPVAILEAMCAGHCVITTRHSGIPEAIEDGVHGLLCDEHDEAAMAANLKKALSDQSLALELGDAARERVLAHFTADQSIAKLRSVMGLA
ncbi:glycosyltransferase [Aestuariibius sp. 2305UL40-4]|uniref:glycosyltransferase n=1 Tax=Aestuariibius violaceus TaxID=3234132 RepID=UPI00345E42B4